jgi:hypothetical protein
MTDYEGTQGSLDVVSGQQVLEALEQGVEDGVGGLITAMT